MKLKKRFIVLLLLGVVGVANAAPTATTNRAVYSRSLNSIASVVMGWYGHLIDGDQTITFKTAPSWAGVEHAHYPKHIKQILIRSTQMKALTDAFQFQVIVDINYEKNHTNYTETLNETFLFNDILTQQPVIKTITLNSKENTDYYNVEGYDRYHYKVREFTYAWLLYLDGITRFKPVMNADLWLETANYTLDMGSLKMADSIPNVLKQRHKLLREGGHLLKSLKVNSTANNQFNIDYIVDWKGVNASGKATIARIHQILTIHLNKKKQWEVISIKEKHLLPVIAPWMGMLC